MYSPKRKFQIDNYHFIGNTLSAPAIKIFTRAGIFSFYTLNIKRPILPIQTNTP